MTKHHERAFPLHPGILPDWQDNAGMTKREYFAGLAMQGMIAHPDSWGQDAKGIAKVALQITDALIAELSKGGDA